MLDGTARGWLRESDFDFVFRDHARNIIIQALEQNSQDKALVRKEGNAKIYRTISKKKKNEEPYCGQRDLTHFVCCV